MTTNSARSRARVVGGWARACTVCPETSLDSSAQGVEGEQQHLVFGREVVLHLPHRHPRLGRDVAKAGSFQALPRSHPAYRVGDALPPWLPEWRLAILEDAESELRDAIIYRGGAFAGAVTLSYVHSV